MARNHPSTSNVTSKGQVTIPSHVRRLLGVKPHDKVMFIVRDSHVEIALAESIVERTKGILKTDMPPMSAEEMREFVEQGVADETMERNSQ